MNKSESNDNRYSPLSVSAELLPWCLWTICLMTMGWSAMLAWVEIDEGRHTDIINTIIAVGKGTSDSAPAIIVYATIIVIATSFIKGGGIMVLGRAAAAYVDRKIKSRDERLRNEGREEGLTLGREEGKEEGAAHTQGQWEGWYRRSIEAKERGEPFDEPPPGLNGRENGHASS